MKPIKRMVYRKTNKEGIYKTPKFIEGPRGKYSVTLNYNNMTFVIKNVNTNEYFYSDKTYGMNMSNVIVLKRNVVKILKRNFGVLFEKELRLNRDYSNIFNRGNNEK